MKQLLVLSIFLSTNVFSQENNDSVEIVQLLVNDYKTMGNWDSKSHIENCTDNYLLVENNEVWDIKRETDYYIKNKSRAIFRKNYFNIKYLRVYGNFAYAVYNLKSDITEDGARTIKTWIESTTFRKMKGKWKIELIHSTPVDLKK